MTAVITCDRCGARSPAPCESWCPYRTLMPQLYRDTLGAPPLVWTTTPPAAPGWWWLRYGAAPPRVARVGEDDAGRLCVADSGHLFPVATYGRGEYRWAGPIPEPREATA